MKNGAKHSGKTKTKSIEDGAPIHFFRALVLKEGFVNLIYDSMFCKQTGL